MEPIIGGAWLIGYAIDRANDPKNPYAASCEAMADSLAAGQSYRQARRAACAALIAAR